MTVREVLEYVDSTKPNNVGDLLKTSWIGEAEGRVLCEICKIDPQAVPEIVREEDNLSVPKPYARLYAFYVMAMIELSEGNMSAYNSLYGHFEKAFVEYGKHFLRNKP